MPDVNVVGAGPNGLAAAAIMARAGLSVEVFEAAGSIGGGTRTAELMQPGHFHDVCSAVHPMALASPFFRAFELARRVDLVTPELSYASPLDGGRAALAYRSLDRTAFELGKDGAAYRHLMAPLVARTADIMDFTQDQLLRIPSNPVAAGIFGARTAEQGSHLWNLRFREDKAPALLSGVAAHAISHQPSLAASGAGLMLGALGHAGGWPIPVGGSAAIAAALAQDIRDHGGLIHTDTPVDRLADLPPAQASLLNVSPRGFAGMAGDALPPRYRSSLESFRYGNGSCKVDFILSGPVPWQAAGLADAGTVHAGGTREEIARSENEVTAGRHPDRPYVLVAQPSRFDATRAPAGRHTLWTYCHVPAGSTKDMTESVTAQLERFAPGFRDLIVDSNTVTAAELARYNRNYIGGDFSVGTMDLRGLIQRPVVSPVPWRTPLPGVYLCSSATPPGPGVTGMPGMHAATYALRDMFGLGLPTLGLGGS
ncbi:phytoene desaturase family protein [Pseudarthrobacter chlorophenolicus]|uniref:phytoene desaturase family protein n=1 Tax=Pseudarthrobacter chlorophenolicus TaxID=85085 RepID=UPI0005F2B760|nr:NAD(P)/FAD-dependent oxidoreductase [Pseudarthrobacter chlorophenolicus]